MLWWLTIKVIWFDLIWHELWELRIVLSAKKAHILPKHLINHMLQIKIFVIAVKYSRLCLVTRPDQCTLATAWPTLVARLRLEKFHSFVWHPPNVYLLLPRLDYAPLSWGATKSANYGQRKWLMVLHRGGPYLFNTFLLTDLTITTHLGWLFFIGPMRFSRMGSVVCDPVLCLLLCKPSVMTVWASL